ncbi:Protein phosphatase 1L [Chelonia mydas]|uniref:Protein phosphatase 1L n=1 Tax=Chelonia mydas TaxID=8469 RepID=M7BX75_CHEMY|nr:Protein phosphatase 1L [Chelonia mydas]
MGKSRSLHSNKTALQSGPPKPKSLSAADYVKSRLPEVLKQHLQDYEKDKENSVLSYQTILEQQILSIDREMLEKLTVSYDEAGVLTCIPALVLVKDSCSGPGKSITQTERTLCSLPPTLKVSCLLIGHFGQFLEDIRGSCNRVQLALQLWGDFDHILQATRALIKEGKGKGRHGAVAYERARSFRDDLLAYGMGHGLLHDPPGAANTPTNKEPSPPQPSA